MDEIIELFIRRHKPSYRQTSFMCIIHKSNCVVSFLSSILLLGKGGGFVPISLKAPGRPLK